MRHNIEFKADGVTYLVEYECVLGYNPRVSVTAISGNGKVYQDSRSICRTWLVGTDVIGNFKKALKNVQQELKLNEDIDTQWTELEKYIKEKYSETQTLSSPNT